MRNWLMITLILLSSADAAELFYSGDPVQIQLGSQEVRVRFPATVEYMDIRAPVRITNVGRDLLLKKTMPLQQVTRLIVREIDSREVYLLDLVDSETSSQNITITRHRQTDARTHPYVALTRFAAQQFYAPARLKSGLPGVVRLTPSDEDFNYLYRGSELLWAQQARWRWQGLEVLAMRVRNATNHNVEIDPRNLRGNWLTATAQHARLGPAGSSRDQTMVYLIRRAK